MQGNIDVLHCSHNPAQTLYREGPRCSSNTAIGLPVCLGAAKCLQACLLFHN